MAVFQPVDFDFIFHFLEFQVASEEFGVFDPGQRGG
jgi:hypothetical protein